MSTSKRRALKTGYHTPYHRTSNTFTKTLVNSSRKDGTPKLSIIKSGPVDQAFYESTVQNARLFSRENNKIIQDFYAIVIGTDKDGKEIKVIPFTKRDLFYAKNSDDEVWAEVEEHLENIKKRYDGFKEKFLQIIFILDKTKKTNSFGQKQLRSLKQKIGREEAARERELQAKEKRQSEIRKAHARGEKVKPLPKTKKKRFIK